jgi:hypothetical protein
MSPETKQIIEVANHTTFEVADITKENFIWFTVVVLLALVILSIFTRH